MLFIYKNPTRAEREAIDKKFGNQPWEKFGPAGDEDGAPHFLEGPQMGTDQTGWTSSLDKDERLVVTLVEP